MTGELAAIGGALCWAGASLAIKPLSTRFSSVSLTCIRTAFGWVFLIIILQLFGKIPDLSLIPWDVLAYFIGSGITGIGMGSPFYIKSLSLIDINKAYPIAYSSWLLVTAVLAAIFLGEPITKYTILGAAAVIVGIVLLAIGTGGRQQKAKMAFSTGDVKGAALALAAGVSWAVSGVLVKIGLAEADPLVVNIVRLPVVILLLAVVVGLQTGKAEFISYNHKSLVQVAISGILAQGLAGVLWFISMGNIGATRSTIIMAASPLFVAPFSVAFFKEKVTLRVVLGILFCISGIWLTVLG